MCTTLVELVEQCSDRALFTNCLQTVYKFRANAQRNNNMHIQTSYIAQLLAQRFVATAYSHMISMLTMAVELSDVSESVCGQDSKLCFYTMPNV